ncbi:MAG: SGNH/GDSL hydrolase family protein [Bacteroidales bacterium]|nr:SGNH/GDSL hydrolase family protein [Bacteroidales bacterium]
MKVLKKRFQKQHLLKVFLLCFSIVAALLLCEAVLRLAVPSLFNSDYYIRTPDLKKVFKPNHGIMPGVSGESVFIINSQGIRGDELTSSHTYKIIAIGGSTTECLYLDQSETWLYLLQETINKNVCNQNVWVGNAGISGRTTRHHLIALQYLPLKELKIDAIIFLIGINDFTKRLSRNMHYETNFLEKPKVREKLIAETFIGGNQPDPDAPFYKKTAIWHLLRKTKQQIFQGNVQDETGKIYITWREHRQNAAKILNELPDLSSALKEYAENITKIIDIAKKKSIRLIFITQPTMWKPDMPDNLKNLLWLGGTGDFQNKIGQPYYSVEALAKGINAYNDVLLRICREKNVECFDLASILDKDTSVFYDDVHFNESGATKVAKALSEYMLMRPPFGESDVAE